VRRHHTQPALLVSCTAPSPPVCVPCSSAALRDPSSRPLRFSTAAALAAFEPAALYAAVSASDAAAAAVLDALDAMCAALRDAADDDDAALQVGLAAAVTHVCFACDTQLVGISGQTRHRFCLAVLSHAFAALGQGGAAVPGGDGSARRTRGAYAKLVSLMVNRSGMTEDGAGAAAAQHFFVLALQRAAGDATLDCEALLTDLVPARGADVAATVDVLCAVIAAGADSVPGRLAENMDAVLGALRQAQNDAFREKLLTLVTLVIPFATDAGVRKRAGAGSTTGAMTVPVRSHGSVMADALKPCVLSACPTVRRRVAEIVELLLSPSLPAATAAVFSDLFSAAAGFSDYLLEALRHPAQPMAGVATATTRPAPRESLTAPVLTALARIAERHPEQLAPKWSYALPVVVRAAALHADHTSVRAAFSVLGGSAASLPAMSAAVAEQVVNLVLHAGATVSASLANGANVQRDVDARFAAGISMLEVLTTARRLPGSCRPALLDCVECVGVLAPFSPGGCRFARSVVDLVLDEAAAELTPELAEKVKVCVLSTWGRVAIDSFSDPSSPTPSLVELLRLVGSALDLRFFRRDAQDLPDAVSFFWTHLPPAVVLDRLRDADGVGGETRVPGAVLESSDLWASSVQNDTNGSMPAGDTAPSASSVETAAEMCRSSVRLYLARLCPPPLSSCGRLVERTLSPHAMELSMPSGLGSFLSHVSHSQDPEHLAAALLLLEESERQGDGFIMERPALFRAALNRADSHSIVSEPFRECVLPLVRALFACCRGSPTLSRDVTLPKELCELALASRALDIPRTDRAFVLHVLSCHDTELRIHAWNAVASARVRGDPAWTAFDAHIADLLGSSTPAAKCFVSSCLEGPPSVRFFAIDLIALNPRAVTAALVKVGLPSVVICAIERRQTYGAYDSGSLAPFDTLESCEACLGQLVSVVTAGVPHAAIDDLHRMLMLLVDVFAQQTSGRGVAKVSLLDLCILRCLAAVLNTKPVPRAGSPPGDSQCAILEYMLQTAAVDGLKQILKDALLGLSSTVRASAVATVGWGDAEEFGVGTAACVLDYAIRHRLVCAPRNGDARACIAVWDVLPSSERDWIALVQVGPDNIATHASNCRRTSCLQLLATAVTHSLINKAQSETLHKVLGSSLLVQALTVASAACPYLSGSAQRLLSLIVRYEPWLFGAADGRLTGLSSHKALVRVLAAKAASSSNALISPAEAQYLAVAALQHQGAIRCDDEAGARADVLTAVCAFSAAITQSPPPTDRSWTAAEESFRAVCARWSAPPVTKVVGEPDLKTAITSWHGANKGIVDAGCKEAWESAAMLIGRQAILASPLLDDALQGLILAQSDGEPQLGQGTPRITHSFANVQVRARWCGATPE
jgi:hypothetical protein